MLRVAVVGIGGWGKNHVRVIRQLANENLVEEVYVVDIDEEKQRYARRVYNAITAYSIDQIAGKVDAAIVATPTNMHFQHAMSLVGRGVHVLVEKPFTSNMEEAIKLVEGAERRGVVVSTGFLLRFHYGIRKIRDLVARGDLGDILSIYAKRANYWPQRVGDLGVVKDLMIHDVDLISFITGKRARMVFAVTGSIRGHYEDCAQALLAYDGFSALLDANWVTPYKTRLFEITGTRCIAKIDFMTNSLTLATPEGISMPLLHVEEPLLVQDRNFLLAVANKGGEVISPFDILYSLAVCEAIAESGSRGRPVPLDEILNKYEVERFRN